MHRSKGEDFAISCLQQTPHVFAPYLETTSGDAGDDIVILALFVAKRPQALNARYFVARRTVIFSQLGLDKGDRGKFVRNDEVGCLIETWDILGALRFSKTHPGVGKDILDGRLDDLANEFAYRIAVRGLSLILRSMARAAPGSTAVLVVSVVT